MRHLILPLIVGLVLTLCGCVSRAAQPAGTYSVGADGTVSAVVRSASDAVPGVVGPQEIFGVAIPLGPFMAKGALLWDGQPWFWTPPAPAPQVAPAAACTPMTVEVEESFTEMVPVQRTRKVQKQVVPLPRPQAQPQCAPAAAPAAAPCACSGGSCDVPMGFLAASK